MPITGETIRLLTPAVTGVDEGNNEVIELSESIVSDVLVAPGSTPDVWASNRPDGARVVFTLHFPKWFTANLRGCEVIVRGLRCRVVGDPQPYTLANTPTRWHMPAEVELVEG